MKPVIITINSDNKVVMSAEEFRRHMDAAYNQGYSDCATSTTSITYLNDNRPWWKDMTICGSTTTDSCSTDKLLINDYQTSISDYIKSKGE